MTYALPDIRLQADTSNSRARRKLSHALAIDYRLCKLTAFCALLQSMATHQAENKTNCKRSEHGLGGILSNILVSILL